jgi:hypothetical protein
MLFDANPSSSFPFTPDQSVVAPTVVVINLPSDCSEKAEVNPRPTLDFMLSQGTLGVGSPASAPGSDL